MIFTILLWMGMTCPMPESCAAVADFNQMIAADHGTALLMPPKAARPWDDEIYKPCPVYQMFTERGGEKSEATSIEICDTDGPDKVVQSLHAAPKAAEYVFEIRARREASDFLPNGRYPYTPKCPDGFEYGRYHADDDWPNCERITHELWLDGVKLGTLKYTEK